MAELPPLETRCPPVDPCDEEAANEELRQRLCKELDHMEKEQLRGTPHYRGHIGASPGPNGTPVAPRPMLERQPGLRWSRPPRGSRPPARAPPADPAAQCAEATCRAKLVPGTPRLGVPPSLRHGHNLKTKWYHIDCMFANFTPRKSKTITDLADVEHLDSLSAPDRRRVAELIDAHAASCQSAVAAAAARCHAAPALTRRAASAAAAGARPTPGSAAPARPRSTARTPPAPSPARRSPPPSAPGRDGRHAACRAPTTAPRRGPSARGAASTRADAASRGVGEGESAVAANALLEIFGAARRVCSLVRLAVAGVAGAPGSSGGRRKKASSPVGVRTMTLVSMGSALFTVAGLVVPQGDLGRRRGRDGRRVSAPA
ncbi:MgtC-like protein [Aureococcus anophagefferens]|nr:MgtC-like protein [Aureococcus anophagefferens]